MLINKGEEVKYLHFQLLCCYTIFVFSSTLFAATENVEPLNAFLTFDTNDWNNAIAKETAIAIRQEIPSIVSVSIMYSLCTGKEPEIISAFNALQNQVKWSVFINSNETFGVLVPKAYDNKLLERMGFGSLKHVASEQIKKVFADRSFDKKQVEINDFRNLFSASTIAKRFFLCGHGGEQSHIGGIAIKFFGEFIHVLFIINTEFLYVDSCFAAGTNLVAIQKTQIKMADRQFTIANVQFPLVIQATTDEITFRGPLDLKRFFSNLNLFLAEKKKNYYLGRPPSGLTISQVIKPLIGDDPEALQLPSVRFPGTNSFFRSIMLDNAVIITDLFIKQLLSQPLIEQYLIYKQKRPAEAVIPVADTVKFILVYPTDCSPITFQFKRPYKFPRFISKIPGSAQHYIGTIKMDSIGWDDFIVESFLSPLHEYFEEEKLYSFFGMNPKAWFIENVIFKKYIPSDPFNPQYSSAARSDLVIYKPMTGKITSLESGGDVSQKPSVTILFKSSDGKFYGAHERLPLRPGFYDIGWTPMSPIWYVLWTRFIYEHTRADVDALFEASGGLEDKTFEERAFNHFKQSVGISFENVKYDTDDIKQAIDYLSKDEPELQGIGIMFFQDLVKNKQFDAAFSVAIPLIEKGRMKTLSQLLHVLSNAGEYDKALELIANHVKDKKLERYYLNELIRAIGSTKEGSKYFHKFINKNYKEGTVFVRQYITMILSWALENNKEDFYLQAVVVARDYAASSETKIQKIAFKIFKLLAERNIGIQAMFDTALKGLASENESISLTSQKIIKIAIPSSNSAMKGRLIDSLEVANPLLVHEIIQEIVKDKSFSSKQLIHLFEIITERIKPGVPFNLLNELSNALFLLCASNIKLSEKEANEMLNACMIVAKECPEFFGDFTKQQCIESIIKKAHEVPIPGFSERLGAMTRAEKLIQ